METFKHIPHEDEYDANAFYITSDSSYVGGIAPELRRYAPDPLAMRAQSKSELDALNFRNAPLMINQGIQSNDEMRNAHCVGNQWYEDLCPRPRSHFQPAVKLDKEPIWRRVGNVIAFLFLVSFFGLLLVYFGAFRVIGSVIREALNK